MILPPLAIFVLFCLHYDKVCDAALRDSLWCRADAVICGSFRILRKRTLTPQKQEKPTRLFLFLMRCSPGFCPISFFAAAQESGTNTYAPPHCSRRIVTALADNIQSVDYVRGVLICLSRSDIRCNRAHCSHACSMPGRL